MGLVGRNLVEQGVHSTFSKEIKHYRYLGEGTNNKAELSAVLDAMGYWKKGIDNNTPVVVCTDSQYVVGILTAIGKPSQQGHYLSTSRRCEKVE